jgi:hypothetical protein
VLRGWYVPDMVPATQCAHLSEEVPLIVTTSYIGNLILRVAVTQGHTTRVVYS